MWLYFFFFLSKFINHQKWKKQSKQKPIGGLIKNSWISLKEAQASAGKLTQKYQLIERIVINLWNKQLIENTMN